MMSRTTSYSPLQLVWGLMILITKHLLSAYSFAVTVLGTFRQSATLPLQPPYMIDAVINLIK